MPRKDIEKRFGPSDRDFEAARDWASENCDDQGLLHVVEDFTDLPWDEQRGVIWVISGDRYDEFMKEHEAEPVDAFGVDREMLDEMEGE